MQKTRGTEIIIDAINNINVVYGSINKNNPKTVFIKLSAWGNTIDYNEDINYQLIIRQITKRIKSFIYSNLNENIFKKDMTMVDMDMRESGITSDKSSFMSCEITLYQLNNYLLDDEILKNKIFKLSQNLCQEVLNRNHHFYFYKNKKLAKRKLEEA